MIDLHTHILPGMDDGAKNVEMSLAMLQMEHSQGVDTVVLTPHFYRDRERPGRFLERRKKTAQDLVQALLAMPEEKRNQYPELCLGAEVAWVPNLADWDELPQLCMGNSKYLLIELPFIPWNDYMIRQLYDLPGRTGFTPVIAHLERYYGGQRREMIDEIISMGVPIQLSADTLLHPLQRVRSLNMLKKGCAHILASDCHNLDGRKPNLGMAMEVVAKKLGADFKNKLIRQAAYVIGE